MTTHVAFFRAINVSGHHTVGMAALKELHAELGLTNLATHLNTGNVIFDSPHPDPDALAARIAAAFAATFGFPTAVMVRTAAELAALHAAHPFPHDPDRPPDRLAIMFVTAPPTPPSQQALRDHYSGPEELVFGPRDFYLYYPHGIGASKLTRAVLERHLQVGVTGRNWNTLTKLVALSRS